MRNSRKLTLALLPLLTACASAPSAPPRPVEQPKLPSLDKVAPAVLEQDFLERMRNFLQGRLPEQISSAPPSPSATPSTKQ